MVCQNVLIEVVNLHFWQLKILIGIFAQKLRFIFTLFYIKIEIEYLLKLISIYGLDNFDWIYAVKLDS